MNLFFDWNHWQTATGALVDRWTVGAQDAIRAAGRDVVVDLARATPPGAPGRSFEEALHRGERNLTANLLRVAQPAPGRGGAGVGALAVQVRKHWRRRRTVRPSGPRLVVNEAAFSQYYRQVWPSIGYTAGGWAAAAGDLGAALPGWITDQAGPGRIVAGVAGGLVFLEMVNAVPWIGEVPAMAARVDGVLAGHEPALAAALLRVVGN